LGVVKVLFFFLFLSLEVSHRKLLRIEIASTVDAAIVGDNENVRFMFGAICTICALLPKEADPDPLAVR
jgi:hypothetical protein